MIKFLLSILIAFALVNAEEQRFVKVTGKGILEIMPNRALIKMGIISIRKTTDSAMSEVSKTSINIFDLFKLMKIDSTDISTTDFNVSKEYDLNNEREKIFKGYKVSILYKINLINIKQLDTFLLNCIRIGSNTISDVSFYHDKMDSLKNEVTKLAMINARLNAINMLKPMNQKIGFLLKASDDKYMDFDIESDFDGNIEAPDFLKGAALGASDKMSDKYFIKIIPNNISISKEIYALFSIL
jgi:uncharacterized protein YggE